jgi:hypothetical protein
MAFAEAILWTSTFSSRVNPCVSTALYGAEPRAAAAVRRELWNQPRCWSLPCTQGNGLFSNVLSYSNGE